MTATTVPTKVEKSLRTHVIDPVDKELAIGTPRSQEYRQGMLDVLALRELGTPLPQPARYQLGTAQADAYFAGCERGHALWRSTQRQPYEGLSRAPSESKRSSLSMRNRDSDVSCSTRVATISGE